MRDGKQPTWPSSPPTVILLGVVFAWGILGMLYAACLTVGEEAADRSGFDFAFYAFFTLFLSLSAFGTHVAAQAWVMGAGRFTRDFAAYMASGVSFSILAGTTLTACGVFPWVINIPMFFSVPVSIMLLHYTRRQQGERETG